MSVGFDQCLSPVSFNHPTLPFLAPPSVQLRSTLSVPFGEIAVSACIRKKRTRQEITKSLALSQWGSVQLYLNELEFASHAHVHTHTHTHTQRHTHTHTHTHTDTHTHTQTRTTPAKAYTPSFALFIVRILLIIRLHSFVTSCATFVQFVARC